MMLHIYILNCGFKLGKTDVKCLLGPTRGALTGIEDHVPLAITILEGSPLHHHMAHLNLQPISVKSIANVT